MTRTEHRKGDINFPFIAFPKAVLASPDWQGLSFRARALTLDLMGQYTGRNNGRLCPSFEVMRRHGWTSKDQLAKAKAELLACPFAQRTRMGHPPRTAEWLGFTWWKLHWHESMDIGPSGWPYMSFSLDAAAIDPNEGRDKARRTAVSVPRAAGRWTANKPSVAP